MVGDLQELDARQAASQELGIDLLLDVAGKQEAVRAEAAEQNDRNVVDRRSAVGRMLGHAPRVRPQDPELDLVQPEPIAGRQGPMWRRGSVKRRRPGLVARTRADHARLVHAPDPVAAEETGEPGDMILVRVRQDQDVDPPIPGRQPLVELPHEPVGVRSAVDEEPPAGAALDEDPIALADIENRDADDPARSFGDREAEGDRRRHERDSGDARPVALRGPDVTPLTHRRTDRWRGSTRATRRSPRRPRRTERSRR